MSNNFRLKIGEFENGWYSIRFISDGGEFLIEASDVPVDPVMELIKAAEGACVYHSTSEAWFSLEPYFYKLIMAPDGDQTKMCIYYVDKHAETVNHNSRLVRQTKEFEYTGDTSDILINMWRGLKELSSRVSGYSREIQVIESAAKNHTRHLRKTQHTRVSIKG